MRLLKAVGLVVFGVLLGFVVTAASGDVDAKVQSKRLVTAGESVEWAGSLPFRFIRDNRTGACYLASLGPLDGNRLGAITAITRTDDGSCF